METIMEEFKTWLIANSKAENTISMYMINMQVFIRETGIKAPTEITEKVVIDYIAKMKGRCGQATCNQNISTLKSFLYFQNILIRFPKTKTPMRRVVKVLKEEDFINKVLPVVDIEFQNVLQVKAYLHFLYYGGLRLEDSTKIKRENFNFQGGYFTAKISKQNLEKQFPLSIRMKDILLKYFVSEAEEINAFNITIGRVNGWLNRIKQHVPELELHAHKFRKSCATNAKKIGMQLEEIKEMMGHKNIATTEIYVKTDDEEIREKFLKLEEEQQKNRKKQRGM